MKRGKSQRHYWQELCLYPSQHVAQAEITVLQEETVQEGFPLRFLPTRQERTWGPYFLSLR